MNFEKKKIEVEEAEKLLLEAKAEARVLLQKARLWWQFAELLPEKGVIQKLQPNSLRNRSKATNSDVGHFVIILRFCYPSLVVARVLEVLVSPDMPWQLNSGCKSRKGSEGTCYQQCTFTPQTPSDAGSSRPRMRLCGCFGVDL